jgi:hypothetical protein
MDNLDGHFYKNQEVIIETPQKNFKGYINKIDDGFLYIVLYSTFNGGQAPEFGAEDYDMDADVSLIKSSAVLILISSGFSKTFIYKPILKDIVKNANNISLKVQIAGVPSEEREGREFLRVNAVIQFVYEEIPMEEFLETKDAYITKPSLTTSVYGIYGLAAPKIFQTASETDSDAPINPKIEKLLVAINSKLDVIISLINPEASIFANIKEKQVSISGSGIMWTDWDKGLKQGSIIKITMLFPAVPQFIVKALAQVIKISNTGADAGQNNSSPVSIACKFTAINEYDRDEIIKFTFEQQRRHIKKSAF